MIERTCKAERLPALDASIECDPGHYFRMDEMLAPPSHFPDALVRRRPDLLEVGKKSALKIPSFCEILQTAGPRMVQRVHDLAENVDLQLSRGSVADPDRLRALVARKPGHLPFGKPFLAGKPVHDLNLRGTSRRRSQQPIAPGARFVVVSGIHESEQRERRVAQQADAVVPVARSANLLRQRCGRCRHNAAGWRICQSLQREE